MTKIQKIIGTFAPMSALFSLKNSKYDKGTFAAGFYFLDWLKSTHQSAWQLLPLYQTQLETGSSTKHVPSPYKSYGIGLDPKYLSESFAAASPAEQDKNSFIAANKYWIHDYSLFCALRDYFQTDDWRKWDAHLRDRNKEVLYSWTQKLKKEIDNCITVQWKLNKTYTIFRKKAAKLGISLIGDLPFYLSFQSPLVWANQDIFDIEKDGQLRFISGVPIALSSQFGRQIWGHPLYKWGSGNQTQKVINFWKIRLLYVSNLFDIIRFDHAKAFFEYCAIDSWNKQPDVYKKGPGAHVFEEIISYSRKQGLSLIAEDAGENLRNLRTSLNKLKIPGIKVFRYSFQQNQIKINKEYIKIADYPKNTVAYTTTHDTETLFTYLNKLTTKQKQKLAINTGVSYNRDTLIFAKILRDAIIASPARMVIIPIQDWLLTTERINIPGTERPINDPNWNFNLKTPVENLPVNF